MKIVSSGFNATMYALKKACISAIKMADEYENIKLIGDYNSNKENRMSGWKKLKIDNLPPDILTGDYEFNYNIKRLSDEERTYIDYRNIFYLLKELNDGKVSVSYRKPEPKAPAHEEIMTKWWNIYDGVWQKVHSYNVNIPMCYTFLVNNIYKTYSAIGLSMIKSADIPPEA